MKAVIPAAGKGTRMYPVTNNGEVSKEMLPINDDGLSAIEYTLMRALASGVTQVTVVSSEAKRDLNEFLASLKSDPVINEVLEIDIVMQQSANGLGDAFCYGATRRGAGASIADDLSDGDPFLGILPDDLFVTDDMMTLSCPVIEQLVETLKKGKNGIGTMVVPDELVPSYGIVKFRTKSNGSHGRPIDFIEKPSIEEAPSNYAVAGMYAFQPSIVAEIDTTQPDGKGEIQITNAMRSHLRSGERYKAITLGDRVTRHDIGRPEGYEAFRHFVRGWEAKGASLGSLHELSQTLQVGRVNSSQPMTL